MSSLRVYIVGTMVVAFSAALSAPAVWLLWNWVAVEVFRAQPIDLFEAAGLCALSAYLFRLRS